MQVLMFEVDISLVSNTHIIVKRRGIWVTLKPHPSLSRKHFNISSTTVPTAYWEKSTIYSYPI